MHGTILQVSVSPGGVPKRAVSEGVVSLGGLAGDSWAHPRFHGGRDKAVLLLAAEVIDRLGRDGFPVFPGALGENLTTRGLHPRSWRAGQIWRAGSARLEMTTVRAPCKTIQVYGSGIGRAIYDAAVKKGDWSSPVWAHSGMYARVVSEGVVCPGDRVELESEQA